MDLKEERSSFESIDCICCGKVIECFSLSASERKMGKKSTPEQKIWNSGVVDKISAGYGSSHDLDSYYIGICDDCINKKVKSGTIFYMGNSLGLLEEDESDSYRRSKLREHKIDNIIKDD